jgi:dipeptidyl aminopeptidase/acylaminoacyl peptidase
MKIFVLAVSMTALAGAQTARFQSSDLLKLRSVGEVRFSPDGTRIAYTVMSNDAPGRPYSQIWVMTVADGKSQRLAGEKEKTSTIEWSPDGQWIAFSGQDGDKTALVISHPDGSARKLVTNLESTNSALPSMGKKFAWSPDSKRLAFVNAQPGPETEAASGDPVVITRYLYKPDAEEGNSHFNDNRRLHIFVTDLATYQIQQLTTGNHYEHSIDWSPDGNELLFVSNREENEDQFFNYDIFALRLGDKSIRRLTATENIEYRPRWSPDGKKIVYQATRRGLTDLETTMEDTHIWLMNADGSGRTELGKSVDNRQGESEWSADGRFVYFTVMQKGNIRLFRMPAGDPVAEPVVSMPGMMGGWSVARDGMIAYAFSGPEDLAQLFIQKSGMAPRKMTALNAAVLDGKPIAKTESFTFISNDNKFEVEAFLTRPEGIAEGSKHPMIVVIHGGPHSQQGVAFNFKNQVYAGLGWATLMVNYRGSLGYGQAFADGVFGDQNGNEAQDVLYGVSAAVRRNLWIDRDRLGVEGISYGGQLSDWLITQTRMFKAAVPIAGISNLVSYNYMTYYNQYEQMEFGIFPHQGNLMDLLWQRSALKYVAQAATPTMLVHGENDNDVPIAEAEQFYVALRDVGVETIFVRYPREGHGLREPRHIIDNIDRCIDWYSKHFTGPK